MTINAPASLLLLLLRAGRRRSRAPIRATCAARSRTTSSRSTCARGNYIFPPRPSMRLTVDTFRYCLGAAAALQHDLDLRLPHPRGRLDGRAGARVHARRTASPTCEAAVDAGLAGRRLRVAAVVLLQRAQRRLPGDRQVPRRAPPVGAHHARPLRRARSAQPDAPVPRADRRLDADRAAAREQHRARRAAGVLGGLRRRAVAAHERLRRGARAADRALRDARAAHAADPGARGRRDRRRRSVRRLVLHRGADRRAGARARGADRRDRRRSAAPSPRSSGRGCRTRIEEAAFAYQRGVEGGDAGRRGRQPLRRTRAEAEPSCTASTRRARQRQAERTRGLRAGRDARRGRGAWPRSARPRRERRATCWCRCATPSANRCTVGEVCDVLRDEWGTYDAVIAGSR